MVTVLFADLVGFTARAETLDPEDVEAILRPYHERLRTELESHGGSVEKFIGDAVMGLFGAPVSHEDDPERAVRAALAIRAAALEQGFEVRIGVNTGEALVSLDADPRAGEAMAAGDVVNTAARLQAAAPTNGILVGAATRRATRDVIDYRGPEHVEAKGKSEPVPAWTAIEARSPFGVDVRQHGAAPLVGRGRELELLTAAFERAVDERSPELVTVVGVPGIGKSRLAWELFQTLDRRPELVRWRQGRSLSYGGGPFWAVAEMVKSHAGILEDDGADATAAKLADAATVVPEGEREWVASHLRTLVGLGTEQARDRAEAFTAWRRFFEGIAEGEPLVLVFEDLHWADDALLDFVDHLVDWAAGAPILVVCSARPELLERRPGWGGGKLNALVLALSPLAETETATLIATALGQSVLPAETQSALLERAGGNPLYAEQFARLYSESGGTEVLPGEHPGHRRRPPGRTLARGEVTASGRVRARQGLLGRSRVRHGRARRREPPPRTRPEAIRAPRAARGGRRRGRVRVPAHPRPGRRLRPDPARRSVGRSTRPRRAGSSRSGVRRTTRNSSPTTTRKPWTWLVQPVRRRRSSSSGRAGHSARRAIGRRR